MKEKLYLSVTDKKVSGVCGGIAEFFGVDSTLIRLAWVLITLFGTAILGGIIAYVLAAMIIPERPSEME